MDHAANGYKSTILTADGLYLDFLKPDPAVITIEAIARGLANTCRFAGQCKRFYSVAEHSVYVSRLVPPELAIQGLLHDAAEAFIGDMPKPLKVLLPDYQAFETVIEGAIFGKFGFSSLHPDVKHADKVMLKTEQHQIMRNQDGWHYTENVQPADLEVYCFPAQTAYDMFMFRAETLGLI